MVNVKASVSRDGCIGEVCYDYIGGESGLDVYQDNCNCIDYRMLNILI